MKEGSVMTGFRLGQLASRRAYRLRQLLVLPTMLAFLLGIWITGPASAFDDVPQKSAPATVKTEEKEKKDDKPEFVYANDDEVKLGRDNVEELEKQTKLITDAAVVERVNRIGQELADIANRYPTKPQWGIADNKKFKYTFKVVDDKDVNAFSLPGGFIYVNKGCIDYCRSDHELAGVLAHEITHAAHHHMVKLLREQKKINNVLLPVLAAALIAGRGGLAGAQNLFMATQLYTVAKINTYGIEAEKDADYNGLMILTHSHYNPVGLYSFMRRLATDERSHPEVELGIYRTHPPGPERATSAKTLLDELKIPIVLSQVDPTMLPTVTPAKSGEGGRAFAEIKMRGVTLCRIVADEGLSADERAGRLAKRLSGFMDSRLQPYEIRVNREQTQVVVRGVALLTMADAIAQNKTLDVLAREMSDAITQINQRQQLESIY